MYSSDESAILHVYLYTYITQEYLYTYIYIYIYIYSKQQKGTPGSPINMKWAARLDFATSFETKLQGEPSWSW